MKNSQKAKAMEMRKSLMVKDNLTLSINAHILVDSDNCEVLS